MIRLVSALFISLAAILFTFEADAYTSLRILDIDPSKPDICFVRERTPLGEKKVGHPIGSSWQTGNCEESTCFEQGGKLFVSTYGCGVSEAHPPCKILPKDFAKPYPACCPKPWCPGDEFQQKEKK